MNELEMRDTDTPPIENTKELSKYIDDLLSQEHNYGTGVYAMSLAATAAFRLVAKNLVVTGFQVSCADLDFIRRIRNIKGPFMLVDGNTMLYPQYDTLGNVAQWMTDEKTKQWLKEQAAINLKEHPSAHPDVIAHWKKLAEVE